MQKEKQKILVDCQILQSKSSGRGYGSYAYRLLDELVVNSEIELMILLNSNGLTGANQVITNYAKKNNLAIYILDFPKIRKFEISEKRLLNAKRNYSLLVNSIKPDVLFILAPLAFPHEQVSTTYVLNKRIRRVCVYYDNFQIQDLRFQTRVVKNEVRKQYQNLDKYDLIISISDFSSLQLSRDFPSARIKTYHLKINLKKNLSEKDLMLSIVGSSRHKNLKGLRSSFMKYALNVVGPIPLVVIGVNPRNKLKGLILRIWYHLPMKEVYRVTNNQLENLYMRSKFVIIPSIKEGLSLPYFEALEYGAIPISSKDIPATNILNDDRFIYEPTNKSSLLKTIMNLDAIMRENKIQIHDKISNVISEYNSRRVSIDKILNSDLNE